MGLCEVSGSFSNKPRELELSCEKTCQVDFTILMKLGFSNEGTFSGNVLLSIDPTQSVRIFAQTHFTDTPWSLYNRFVQKKTKNE